MLSIENFRFHPPKEVIERAVSDAIRPPEKITVDEWADKYRLLSTETSPESGPWRTSRTPFLKEIMRELSPQSKTITVTLVKGAQVGGTECGNNWVGAVIDKYPAPIMLVTPSLDMLKKNSKTRIQPMIDSCPSLREKVKKQDSKEAGNSLDLKIFNGGVLVLATAGSATALRSQPVKYLFLDEMSAYDADVEDEGDPVALAKARTNNFGRKKKIFQCSTPTIRGICRIEQEFAKSDRRYYNVPCPFCGQKFVITFDKIKYQKDENNKLIKDSVHCECPKCKEAIAEKYKTWMFAEENGAEWVPTVKTDGLHKGYHLSSLYSPLGWNSWVEIVENWIHANEQKKKGDFSALKTFVNTQLGETWEDPAARISESQLWNQREQWSHEYQVPYGGVFLTVGADVQKDRIEASVYAFGENEEIWAIDHKVLFGNPPDRQDQVWDRLDDLIYKTRYKHESGAMLPISIACVDSGSWSDVVYQYIMDKKQKGVYAVKGDGREDHSVIRRAKQVKIGTKNIPVTLFNVGTFEIKRMLNLRVQAPKESRTIHYPVSECFDEEFFKQLASEYMVTKYNKGFPKRHFELPSGYRNEALDCFVYAFAGKRIADPSIKLIKQQLGLSEDREQSDVEVVKDSPQPTHMDKVQEQRRNQWKRPKNSWLHKGRV